MKKIFLLLCCFSFLSLKGQISNIKLTKVKINSKDKYPIKGYLFDLDEEQIVVAPNRKYIKGALLTGKCKSCHTISRILVQDIKVSQKKAFLPIGTMTTGGLGLILIATADNTPNPDGINDRQAFQILTLMGLAIGGVVDLLRLIGHNKKKPIAMNIDLSNVLQPKSALYQFNEQRKQQLTELAAISQQIEKDKTSYPEQIRIYTKDKKLVVGYIIGQKDDMLLIGLDISNRTQPSNQLEKVALQNIFYYQFDKEGTIKF